MIASLHGKVENVTSEWAVINVNGIGFRVYLTNATLSELAMLGTEVSLHTHLYLREDNATIYGFSQPEELGLFQTLIGVSGLGPRLALAMLSALSVEQISMAIATGNDALLTVVPGVGKKLAGRIILELKEKIGAAFIATPVGDISRENNEVLAALTAMGYSVTEASRAVATLPADENLDLEDRIKLALRYFAAG
jgi:Holliday junction DNA helicase RuvA